MLIYNVVTIEIIIVNCGINCTFKDYISLLIDSSILTINEYHIDIFLEMLKDV